MGTQAHAHTHHTLNTHNHTHTCTGKRRLGGTALAQVFGQIGDCSPDVGDGSADPTPDDFAPLNKAFDTVQGQSNLPGVTGLRGLGS